MALLNQIYQKYKRHRRFEKRIKEEVAKQKHITSDNIRVIGPNPEIIENFRRISRGITKRDFQRGLEYAIRTENYEVARLIKEKIDKL